MVQELLVQRRRVRQQGRGDGLRSTEGRAPRHTVGGSPGREVRRGAGRVGGDAWNTVSNTESITVGYDSNLEVQRIR